MVAKTKQQKELSLRELISTFNICPTDVQLRFIDLLIKSAEKKIKAKVKTKAKKK